MNKNQLKLVIRNKGYRLHHINGTYYAYKGIILFKSKSLRSIHNIISSRKYNTY